MHNYFSLAVLQIENRMLIISQASLCMLVNSLSLKYSVLYNNRNQYSVSYASFNAIAIFAVKSALLCPLCASETLAPMLVPLRNNCFYKTYSFFLSLRYLDKLTILTAKAKLLSTQAFSFIATSLCILHYALCILDCATANSSQRLFIGLSACPFTQ